MLSGSRRQFGGKIPEYDGFGLSVGFQAVAEEIGIPMPELDLVSGCGSGFESECLADYEGHSFSLGFSIPGSSHRSYE